MPTVSSTTIRSIRRSLPAVLLAAACAGTAAAGTGLTIGLLQSDPGSFEGYTLFNQLQSSTSYLIDHEGQVVHTWEGGFAIGNSLYLLEDGRLLRTADPGGNPVFGAGGDAGLIEIYEWDGTLAFSFLYSDSTVRAHHDVALLPSGNVLVLAWEGRSEAQSLAAGRDPALLTSQGLWPEHIVEVVTDGVDAGTIVWEWHIWDHLVQDFDEDADNFGVVGDHPELLDINAAASNAADWLHANAIDYNESLDQILISSPRLNEFFVIDHSTTTEEAAGHTGGASGRGGDLLYRWGNPANYDAGTTEDQRLFGQHDVHWIDEGLPGAGHIMAFNNGLGRPEGAYSSMDEIDPPVDEDGHYELRAGEAFGPAGTAWTYTADPPESMYGSFISGVRRLPNGNTLICVGPTGRFIEVTAAGERVWYYINPLQGGGPMTQGQTPAGNLAFRAERYAQGFPGFAGRDLTPGWPAEIYPCLGDFANDGAIGVDDLLRVLSAWGDPGGFEDLDQNGVVEIGDLLLLLAEYGGCA